MAQAIPTRFKAYCIHRVIWQGISLEIGHMHSWCQGMDHIEIRSWNMQPLPITETGYRSLFLSNEELKEIGDPVVYVMVWLDREAAQSDWYERQQQAAQLSLF
ncbi:MAG: hypothetical protein OIF58_05190 [Cohaesibacter sp.]|nr:hypothetical protein [Cohaesibacter sp.]